MNIIFLAAYGDVLLLTRVTEIYVSAPKVQSQQEQGDDEDENDDCFGGLHC